MCYNKYINRRRQKAFYCLTVSAASEAVYFFLLFSTLCNRKQKKGIRGITISLPMLLLCLKARAISKKYGVSPQHKPARKAHPANALNFISRRNCCSRGFVSLSIMKVIAVSLVCCTGRSAALCAAPSIKPLLYEEKLLFISFIPHFCFACSSSLFILFCNLCIFRCKALKAFENSHSEHSPLQNLKCGQCLFFISSIPPTNTVHFFNCSFIVFKHLSHFNMLPFLARSRYSPVISQYGRECLSSFNSLHPVQ